MMTNGNYHTWSKDALTDRIRELEAELKTIERRTLERAAVKCREQAQKHHAEHHLFPALNIERGLRLAMAVGSAKCEDAIRAMIKEKE